MTEFHNGAKVRRKPLPPINQEFSFPEFIVFVAKFAVTDFKVDRDTFLRYCASAYDAISKASK